MRLHGEIDSLGLSKLKKNSDVSRHYFVNQVDFSLIHCVCRICFDKIYFLFNYSSFTLPDHAANFLLQLNPITYSSIR